MALINLKTDYTFTGGSGIYTWDVTYYKFNTETLGAEISYESISGSFEAEYSNYSRDPMEPFYTGPEYIYYHDGNGGFTTEAVELVFNAAPSCVVIGESTTGKISGSFANSPVNPTIIEIEGAITGSQSFNATAGSFEFLLLPDGEYVISLKPDVGAAIETIPVTVECATAPGTCTPPEAKYMAVGGVLSNPIEYNFTFDVNDQYNDPKSGHFVTVKLYRQGELTAFASMRARVRNGAVMVDISEYLKSLVDSTATIPTTEVSADSSGVVGFTIGFIEHYTSETDGAVTSAELFEETVKYAVNAALQDSDSDFSNYVITEVGTSKKLITMFADPVKYKGYPASYGTIIDPVLTGTPLYFQKKFKDSNRALLETKSTLIPEADYGKLLRLTVLDTMLPCAAYVDIEVTNTNVNTNGECPASYTPPPPDPGGETPPPVSGSYYKEEIWVSGNDYKAGDIAIVGQKRFKALVNIINSTVAPTVTNDTWQLIYDSAAVGATGTVQTVSLNGGEPVAPDEAGNIDLEVPDPDLSPYSTTSEITAADAEVLADANDYTDSIASQIISTASGAGDTLAKLEARIAGLSAIVGSSTSDGDAIVNTVTELLSVFSSFPESTDIFTLINSKSNSSDIYNALDSVIVGKPLDSRQGKTLNDLITTANTAITALQNGKLDKTALVSGIGTDATKVIHQAGMTAILKKLRYNIRFESTDTQESEIPASEVTETITKLIPAPNKPNVTGVEYQKNGGSWAAAPAGGVVSITKLTTDIVKVRPVYASTYNSGEIIIYLTEA